MLAAIFASGRSSSSAALLAAVELAGVDAETAVDALAAAGVAAEDDTCRCEPRAAAATVAAVLSCCVAGAVVDSGASLPSLEAAVVATGADTATVV